MSLQEQTELPESELGDITVQASNFVEQYGKQIVFAVVAVLIVFAVGIAITNSGREASEESWSRFAGATGASDYANVATDFAGSDVAVWARLTEGELLLREAIQLQFTDREAANRQFKAAGEALDSVLSSGQAPDVARERALMGQARLAEATSDGSTDAAIAAYEKIVSGFPGSVYTDAANERIAALKSDESKSFYAWFAKQTPKPEDRAKPQDGLPAGHPEVPVTLPPIPEDLFPADWSDLKVDAEEPPFESTDEASDEKTEDAATPSSDASSEPADSTESADKE